MDASRDLERDVSLVCIAVCFDQGAAGFHQLCLFRISGGYLKIKIEEESLQLTVKMVDILAEPVVIY